MSFPNDVKYTKDHEWLRIEGNEAYVGITHFAQSELGDIVCIDVDTEGESLEKEEVFGSVEAVKTVSDLFMPVNGEVLEFNENLEDNPISKGRCQETPGSMSAAIAPWPTEPPTKRVLSRFEPNFGF